MKFIVCCEIPASLTIGPDLIGRSHTFKYHGREVHISLPETYSDEMQSGVQPEKERLARCVGWRDERCTTIAINHVNLTIEILESDGIKLSQSKLISNIDKHLWIEGDQDAFRDACASVSNLGSQAFDYWIRVARWKTGNSSFGPPITWQNPDPGFRYVACLDPDRHVVTLAQVVRAFWRVPMSSSQWLAVQHSINLNEQVPIWIDTYHDAQRRAQVGDRRGALLELAISAESYLQNKLSQVIDQLPSEEPAIKRRLETWGISEVIANVDKISTLRSLKIGMKARKIIKALFEKRNQTMHGKITEINESEIRSMMLVVLEVIGA